MNTQPQFPTSYLLSLPAELRTNIYEYVYPANQQGYTTDLANVDSPSKDLLLTSKIIHHEAKTLHKASFRNFWSQRNFVLDCRPSSTTETAQCLHSLRDDDLNHITSLTMYSKTLSSNWLYKLVDPRGGWRVVRTWGVGSNDVTFRRYRRWVTRQSPNEPSVVDPTRAAYDSYRDEEELRDACEKYSRNPPPMRIQVMNLLGIQGVSF